MDQPTNQLKMENAISQGKFLDLVNLVSKTLCTFLILSFTYKLMALHHFGAASSNTEQNYMQAHEQTAISTALHTPKV